MPSNSRYTYACAGCDGTVSKTPCEKQPEPETKIGKDGKEKQPPDHKKEYAGLHGWKCNKCGNGIKVSRKMRKQEEK